MYEAGLCSAVLAVTQLCIRAGGCPGTRSLSRAIPCLPSTLCLDTPLSSDGEHCRNSVPCCRGTPLFKSEELIQHKASSQFRFPLRPKKETKPQHCLDISRSSNPVLPLSKNALHICLNHLSAHQRVHQNSPGKGAGTCLVLVVHLRGDLHP